MKYDPCAGTTINNAVKTCCELANQHNKNVEMTFNGIIVTISPNTSDKQDVYIKYYHDELDRQHQEYINSEKYKQLQKDQEAKELQRKTDLELLLKDAPDHFTVIEEFREKYEKQKELNTDPYGTAVMKYMDLWARLMEGQINKGIMLKDCADKLSHIADIEGITGFMYGAAVAMLSDCWIYGEELRKWHNGEYNYEGDGVVNPAILTIGA